MSDVTLSSSVRQSLLSLQGTTSLIEKTQNRLSTGLRVSSAIDDPVAFFQAKSLLDRASDLLEKKDGIDQGISTVTVALDGVESIESLVKQMKGISNSMKSATTAQMDDLVTQFNDIRTQINNLAADATYQGTNLINGAGQTLSIEFSEQTASLLTVSSVDLRAGTAGLSITSAANFTGGFVVNGGTVGASTGTAANLGNRFLSTTSDFSLTWAGPANTFSAGETVSFTYGTGSTYSLVVATAASLTVANGGVLDVDVVSSTTAIASGKELALKATASRNLIFGFSAQTGGAVTGQVSAGNAITVTYQGATSVTLTTADGGLTFTYGTGTVTLNVAAGQTLALTGAGDTVTLSLLSGAAGAAGLTAATGAAYVGLGALGISAASATSTGGTKNLGIAIAAGASAASVTASNAYTVRYVQAGDTSAANAAISELDSALITLRTQAQTLGSNVALLNTRLDFTQNYVNTLQGGADKLTLADINEEGANLLALQTRQQLGIQSLSLAAQAEASILRLFG